MVSIKDVKPVPVEAVRKRATLATGTPDERRERVRHATTGLKAHVKVTKAMYRPGSGK